MFRKIERDHPTVLLDEVDTMFGDRATPIEGIRALFNAGNRRGTKWNRVARGRAFELGEFDVFCPEGDRRDRWPARHDHRPRDRHPDGAAGAGEPIERLRSRRADDLGSPLRDALAEQVGAIQLSLVDENPPRVSRRSGPGRLGAAARDRRCRGRPLAGDRAQCSGRHLRRALAATTTSSAAGSWRTVGRCSRTLGPRSCRRASSGRLIELDSSRWADIRGRESRPTTSPSSWRVRHPPRATPPAGSANPVHDLHPRSRSRIPGVGTSLRHPTHPAQPARHRSIEPAEQRPVPDVSIVSIARGGGRG